MAKFEHERTIDDRQRHTVSETHLEAAGVAEVSLGPGQGDGWG